MAYGFNSQKMSRGLFSFFLCLTLLGTLLSPGSCWEAGPEYLLTGQLELMVGFEAVFNVTVANPCLDFTWKVLTQDEQVTVHVTEQYQWDAYQFNRTFEYDSWLSAPNASFNPHLPPGRQLFAGAEPTARLYFILKTASDQPLVAAWSVSYSEEIKDTISASTVYTMALTVSILGALALFFGVATLFFFFYRVPPSHQPVQRI